MLPPLRGRAAGALRLLVDGADADGGQLVYPDDASGEPQLFASYSVPMPAHAAPRAVVRQLRPAGPPRVLDHKPTEPNVTEWEAAAVWGVTLEPAAPPPPSTDLWLRLRYVGDGARFQSNDTTVLFDDWFTGYEGPGQMHAGLSYVAAEQPEGSIFGADANLTLRVLPLQRSALEKNVWLRRDYWPDFDGDGLALGLSGVDVLQSFRARLVVP